MLIIKNIKGQFDLPVFTDRQNTPNSGNYLLNFDIAGKEYQSSINIQYDSPFQGQNDAQGANVTSFITKIDKNLVQNEYKQTIYVNPKENSLRNMNVNIQGYTTDSSDSSTKVDLDNTNIKVYEVNDASKLSESYYVNPNDPNLKDVTSNFEGWITDTNNNSINVKFGDTNKAYVIVVDGHFDDSGKILKHVLQKQT